MSHTSSQRRGVLESNLINCALKSTGTENLLLTKATGRSSLLNDRPKYGSSTDGKESLFSKYLQSATAANKVGLVSTQNSFLQSKIAGSQSTRSKKVFVENQFLKRKRSLNEVQLPSDQKHFQKADDGACRMSTSSVHTLDEDEAPRYSLEHRMDTNVHQPSEAVSKRNLFQDKPETNKKPVTLNADEVPRYSLEHRMDTNLSQQSEAVSIKKLLQGKDETNKKLITLNEDEVEAPRYLPEHFMDTNLPQPSKTVSIRNLLQDKTESNKKLITLKASFLSTVSTSLVNKPAFKKSNDITRKTLMELAQKIVKHDPEFILKVALYTRQELNIRTTTNFILAMAANMEECKNYLRKYYQTCIRLPNDWIETVEIYQTLDMKKGKPGSVPSMLRKEMTIKFAAFDEYQLAKYNKKKKKAKVVSKKVGVETPDDDECDIVLDDGDERDLEKAAFSLKRLIRLLHITSPHESVMALLGKKYPLDAEEFRKSGLPGSWEKEKAGTRMKLPVPLTWETQLSEKGNTAAAWQDLLDSRKLPYMAMLRNLCNLLRANLSSEHNKGVLNLLSNKKLVAKSRQFPMSFYSAHKSVSDLEKLFNSLSEFPKASKESLKGYRSTINSKRGEDAKKIAIRAIIRRKQEKRLKNLDLEMLEKYKEALEKAVEISLEKNVNPVPGRTLVICDLLTCYESEKQTEENILLGLMCLHACEECELKVTGSTSWLEGNLTEQPILKQVQEILQRFESEKPLPETPADTFYRNNFKSLMEKYLNSIVIQEKQFDNIILLTNGKNLRNTVGPEIMKTFLQKYRHLVNPCLLYVQVDLTGQKSSTLPEDPLNVELSGASDQLLRFLAEKGNEAQLAYVESIDKTYKLSPMPKSLLPKEITETPLEADVDFQTKWRTVRVFISSTFKDMHGERDMLVRYIFPELRARCRPHCLHIQEVDLRWGITQEDSDKSLVLCLSELSRCQLFVGILGERYGAVPSNQGLPRDPEFAWVHEYPPGASVTELEMHAAALANPKNVMGRAFFYFRDNSFQSSIPLDLKKEFGSEDQLSFQRIGLLKERIKKSQLEVYDGYPCKYGGIISGVPLVSHLEQFGQRVLDNLWNSIQKHFLLPEVVASNCLSLALESSLSSSPIPFIGRESFIPDCLNTLNSPDKMLLVTGKVGSGKTAFLMHLKNSVLRNDCFFCDIGGEEKLGNVIGIYQHLWEAVTSKLNLNVSLPKQKEIILSMFWKVMDFAAGRIPSGKLIIILDGLNHLKSQLEQTVNWLPAVINPSIKIIFSATEGSTAHKGVVDRTNKENNLSTVTLSPLVLADRKSLVTAILKENSKALSSEAFNNQMMHLVTKRDAGYPLYLFMACRELRLSGLFENLSRKILSLPQTLSQLVQDSLNQMEKTFGQELLQCSLCCICLTPEGLEEVELHMILSVYFNNPVSSMQLCDIKKLFVNLPPNQLLPHFQFASLVLNLKSFLNLSSESNSETKLKPTCAEIANIIRNRFMGSKSVKNISVYHKLLAALFLSKADPVLHKAWQGQSSDAFHALPQHLISSGCLLELTEALCSFKFLTAVFKFGSALALYEVISNFMKTASANKAFSQFMDDKRVQDYRSFLKRNMYRSGMHYRMLLQQALCEPQKSIVFTDATSVKKEMNVFLPSEDLSQQSCQRSMSGFPSNLLCVVSKSEGKFLAVGDTDGMCALLSGEDGKLIHNLQGHSQGVCAICFVGSNIMCTASIDGTLSLWNIVGGYRLSVLSGHERRVSGCCSEPSGKIVVSSGWDHCLRVWNVKNGILLSTIDNKCPVNCVAHHPTQAMVASGDWKGKVKLWDLETLTRKAIFHGHCCSVSCISFNSDATLLASGSLNGDVILWSVLSGTPISKPWKHFYSVKDLVFNGAKLISAATDGTLKIWSDHWGSSQWNSEVPSDKIQTVRILSDDLLAVGCDDGNIFIFTLKGEKVYSENLHEPITCISPYYNSVFAEVSGILVGTYSGEVKLSELLQPAKLSPFVVLHHYHEPISCIYSAFGFAFIGFKSGKLACVNINASKSDCSEIYDVHEGSVTSVSIISKRKILTTSHDKTFKLWLFKPKFVLLKVFPLIHNDWITCSCYYSSSELLVTGCQDTTLLVWDMKTQDENQMLILSGLNEPVLKVQIIDSLIIACGISGSLGVWDVKGKLVAILPSPHNGPIISNCRFKKSGRSSLDEKKNIYIGGHMITADTINSFSLRTPFSPTMAKQLVGHTQPALGCALLNDQSVVSTSLDKSLKWWSVDEMVESENKTLHARSKITAVDISANGQRGLSSDSNGKIALWDILQNKLSYLCHLEYPQASISAAVFSDCNGKGLAYSVLTETENQLIFSVESGKTIRKENVHLVDQEVTCLEFSTVQETVMWADRSGCLSICNKENRQNKYKVSKDWILKTKFSSENKEKHFIANLDGSVELASTTFADRAQGSMNIKLSPMEKFLITSLDVSDKQEIFVGLSNGSLRTATQKGETLIQIHGDAVSGVKISGQYLFTSSKDGTIKVWERENMIQVGQFNSEISITSMSVWSSKQRFKNILYGTLAGSVHILTWYPKAA